VRRSTDDDTHSAGESAPVTATPRACSAAATSGTLRCSSASARGVNTDADEPSARAGGSKTSTRRCEALQRCSTTAASSAQRPPTSTSGGSDAPAGDSMRHFRGVRHFRVRHTTGHA
jgi:hypothetical protein